MESCPTLATILLLASMAMGAGNDAKGNLTPDIAVYSGLPCNATTGW